MSFSFLVINLLNSNTICVTQGPEAKLIDRRMDRRMEEDGQEDGHGTGG